MGKKKKASSNSLEVQNAAKTLFANIRFMSPDAPLKSIALTSAVPNEGKSTTAVELAKAIATSGKRTLLVEADMRRRSLANMLGVRGQAGVYAVITKQATIDQAVVSTKVHDLFLLDSEPNIPNPADILSSKGYAHLVHALEGKFDYVVFDTPPVGTFVDAAILSTLVDGVVVVVKPGSTRRDELLSAFEQLKKADANVIGTCATFCEGTGSEYYYYAYYTQSGKRVKPDKHAEAAPAPAPQPQFAPVRPAGQAAPGAARSNTPHVNRAGSASSAGRRGGAR